MTVSAHPSDERLAAFAAGSLSAGLSLLVATHLALCPACRSRVRRLELIGGALLRGGPEARVAAPDRAAVLRRIAAIGDGPDEPAPGEPAPEEFAPDAVLPAPLRAVLGGGIDAVRWRFLFPGLADHRIAGFPGEEVSLLRGKPGTRILTHTHEGEETTLVLTGALRDDGSLFRRGDVSECDARHEHRPEIAGDEPCICLVVLTGRMRFTGRLGRALNLLQP